MPFTRKQQKLFHAMDEDPEVAREHGTSSGEAHKLAEEADRLKRRGKERPAVKGFVDLRQALGIKT